MIALIECGDDTHCIMGVQCEGSAIFEAIRFAKGRAYKLMLYHDRDDTHMPFKILEQASLLGKVFEITPGLEVPKEVLP